MDPRGDPKSLVQLYAAAERAKRTLSKLNQATVTCTHNGKVMTVPLTRAEPGRPGISWWSVRASSTSMSSHP